MTFTWTTTQIQITSTTITSFIADNTKTLKLEVWLNCGTPVVINITAANQATYIANGKVVLNPAALSQSGTFTVGIYRFQLSYLATQVQIDNGLLYIDTGINCKLVDLVSSQIDCLDKPCADGFTFWAFGFHYLLSKVQYCDEGSYTNACKLFQTMSDILETEVNCGC